MSISQSEFNNPEQRTAFEAAAQGDIVMRLQIEDEYVRGLEDVLLGHAVKLVVSTGIGDGPLIDVEEPGFNTAILARPVVSAWLDGYSSPESLRLPIKQVEHRVLKENKLAIVNPVMDGDDVAAGVDGLLNKTKTVGQNLRSALTIAGLGTARRCLSELDRRRSDDVRAEALSFMARLTLDKL